MGLLQEQVGFFTLLRAVTLPSAARGSHYTRLPTDVFIYTYGVATVSRIDEIIGLFCRILSLL